LDGGHSSLIRLWKENFYGERPSGSAAIARSYYRRRSPMRLRVSKSRDDWMDRMAAVKHATKPKDEVNADLLVIAAGT